MNLTRTKRQQCIFFFYFSRSGPDELNNRCERAISLSVTAATSLVFSSHQNPSSKPFDTCAHFTVSTKVRQSMPTHYHKAEGIQIIGPLKLSNVNWAKLQRARVAVAEADAYIITVCCLPWQEKKTLMNLPWLPVFSTIILIAHIVHVTGSC